MTTRRRYILGLFAAGVGWIVISTIFWLPPAGQIYIGQSLSSCIGEMKQIEGMKATYALEKGLHDGDSINLSDFGSYFDGRIPKCPGGGVYTYNKIGVPTVCSFAGTTGLEPQKELVMYFFWRWKIPPIRIS